MNLSETQKGDWAVLASTLLWGLTPIMVILSYGSLTALMSLCFTTLFAAVFFGLVLTARGKWKDFQQPGIFKYLFLIALFIGILYYSLYFLGLKTTSAGNASLILLMEAFFSYLLFNVWKKEQFDSRHIIGGLLMIVGAVMVLLKNASSLNRGDFFILLATMCAPMGNYYQKFLRQKISSEAVLFGRSIITVPAVFILALLFREKISALELTRSFWFLLINGFVLLGLCKLLWVEGIHRISVTKAVALESIGPLFTLTFAYLILHQKATLLQLSAFIPLVLGLILLTKQTSLKAPTALL